MFTIISSLICYSPANAATITLNFDKTLPGKPIPTSPTPWLKAVFEDTSNRVVTLTLSAPNLNKDEFVTAWDFNFNIDATKLTIAPNVFAPTLDKNSWLTLKTDSQAFTVASFKFDAGIDFADSNGKGITRFTDDQTATFTITSSLANFGASSLFDLNLLGSPSASIAHIQGMSGGQSTYVYDAPSYAVATPEPGTMLLMGVGAAGAAWMRRRRARQS